MPSGLNTTFVWFENFDTLFSDLDYFEAFQTNVLLFILGRVPAMSVSLDSWRRWRTA